MPMPLAAAVAEDRAFRVPPGAAVRTGYVPAHRIRLACEARMAVGDVDAAYRRRLQFGPDQPWPPPVGEWEVDPCDGARQFAVVDGRHEVIAALMLGFRAIFVAWLEGEEGADSPGQHVRRPAAVLGSDASAAA